MGSVSGLYGRSTEEADYEKCDICQKKHKKLLYSADHAHRIEVLCERSAWFPSSFR